MIKYDKDLNGALIFIENKSSDKMRSEGVKVVMA